MDPSRLPKMEAHGHDNGQHNNTTGGSQHPQVKQEPQQQQEQSSSSLPKMPNMHPFSMGSLTPTGQLTTAQRLQLAIAQQEAAAAARDAALASGGKTTTKFGVDGEDEPTVFYNGDGTENSNTEISDIGDFEDNDGEIDREISQLKNELVHEKENTDNTDTEVSRDHYVSFGRIQGPIVNYFQGNTEFKSVHCYKQSDSE